jgi:hypothetical protein
MVLYACAFASHGSLAVPWRGDDDDDDEHVKEDRPKKKGRTKKYGYGLEV